jgi:hypothetical protein
MHTILRPRCCALLIAALVAAGGQAGKAKSLTAEAYDFGWSLYQGKYVLCGKRFFVYTVKARAPVEVVLTELTNANLYAFLAELSTEDRLNGVQFRGQIELRWDAERYWQEGAWTSWAQSQWPPLSQPTLSYPFFFYIERKNGQWNGEQRWTVTQENNDKWTDASSKLNCASIPKP